ncbi:Stk1 family PASTA domain-containing Ser/Thr kinase [Planosporangium flavigriseum]|uniref:non-specific serine/threonine protein kinase n=1 Tax=Planosporangium flavigriseum TaxID=373681 RepID=A0A8J3PKP2_9ACTN|nr:Stk1 family PASTA domain-containing Ser/Thr kinase [Planosporangium flavigriseum]NJC64416.1 Stk1 family PASTA domain-containing Ser/Thr kinase [Planosporangium flavigriseum]GIG72108.1 serine/threonine-protein kinase PknB [Planosporangium flavigriseum]
MTAQARLLGGRYQVGELLGYGGMAEVHRGRDLRLGRDVAIKTLRSDLARDAIFQLRFRREAQNAAALNHPAIVAVYDTGEEHGPSGEELPYIVMEFVNGRTLKEVLGAEGRLMPRRALEIVADICSALEFSHRHGIIHRDIKPGNVMLTQTGQVKVMDFGIARALASGASTMTQTSAVIGTAQYLSPEQARGESVDARSDVYATGCVIYELLCGHPPFVGDNPVSVAYQHVREDPRAPSSSNPDVTPPIDAIVLKALAKNPANRYQSAGEMRADLLRAAAGRPVLATPVMRDDERTAMIAPQPAAQAGPQTRPVARVAPPPRRNNTWVAVALTLLGLLAVGALAVGLYVANKKSFVAVPNLKGRNSAEAQSLLAQAKLKPSPSEFTDPNCAQNTVADQSPTANSRVEAGTVVQYRVCLGPGQTTVPQLVGLSRESATQALKDANLAVGRVTEANSDQPANTVIDSNPKSRTAIKQNNAVDLVISKGNVRKVPDVTGKTETEARATIQAAGFKASVVPQDAADPSQVGRVIGQNPDGDTTAEAGKTVTIIVGRATAPPPPPPSAAPSASAGPSASNRPIP